VPNKSFRSTAVSSPADGASKGGIKKPHYAWIVAGITFATLLTAGGIRGSSGILIVPLEAEFHWSRATISFAIAVNLCLYGLIGPFAAALMETIGLRWTVLGALAFVGAGILLTPTIDQSWQLVALWGGFVGVGTGVTANVLAVTVATRWFAAKRGLVIGLLTSAAAAGQLLFLPILADLTVTHGWRWMSFSIAGVTFLLIPAVAILMRDRPENMGLLPYGSTQEPAKSEPDPRTRNPIRVAFEALFICARSFDFWLIAGSIFICGASTQGLIGTHLIPACLDQGIPEVAAASLLAGMAVFNFVGATASGWLSDRFDPRLLLALYYGLRGASLIYLPYAFDSLYGLATFSIFYGLDWIATIPATIRLTTSSFGVERAGVVFGWIMAIHQIGGAAAAFVAGALRMDLGTYLQAFMLSGLLCFLAACMVIFIGRTHQKPKGFVFSS